MIDVLKVLYPYIILFYIIDCFIYIKHFQIAFQSPIGTGYTYIKKGLRFIGLSPICRLYIVHNLPVFFSQNNIYIWKKSECCETDLYLPESFFHFNYHDIKSIKRDDTQLVLNDDIKINVHSSATSSDIEKKIRILKETPPGKRNDVIHRYLETSLDTEAIKKNRFNVSTTLSALELSSIILCIVFFLLIPCILYIPIRINILLVLILAAFLYLMIMVLSVLSVKKKIAPNSSGLSTLLAILIFSPVTSIHVIHFLTKPILDAYDYIAVSAALLTPDDLNILLKTELKRIHFSKVKSTDTDLTACLEVKEKSYHRFLSASGLSKDDILIPPARKDINAYSYCPMCEAEFVKSVDVCPECNIDLINFQ